MRENGERILDSAREIAFPRYPGTEGNERARNIIAGWFESLGLDVTQEEFSYDIRPAMRALRGTLLASAVLIAAATILALAFPLVALGVLGMGLLLGTTLVAWAPGAEKLYARPGPTTTANIVARRPVANPQKTIVLLAHHDSKSQNLTFPWRMGFTLAAIAGCLGLLLALVTGTLRGEVPAWSAAAPGGLATLALLGLSTLRSGNESPGGVDNAGSVAILRELARVLPEELPENVELIFLSTGAEEDHMVGAMRFLDRNLGTFGGRPVLALNFDGSGAPGRLVLLERFGFGKRFSPRLSAAARRAARRIGIRPRGVWMPPAMGIDAIPFFHRGVECITLSSGSLDRATAAVHSSRDTADHLDADTLALSARYAREIVHEVLSESRA